MTNISSELKFPESEKQVDSVERSLSEIIHEADNSVYTTGTEYGLRETK